VTLLTQRPDQGLTEVPGTPGHQHFLPSHAAQRTDAGRPRQIFSGHV